MRIRRVMVVIALAGAVVGCSGPGQETAPSVPPLVSVSTPPITESPSPTPTVTPTETSKVADTLCVRMDPALVQSTLAVPVVNIQPKAPPAEIGVPTYDVCQLTLSTRTNGPVLRVGVSVLPATKATLAATLKEYGAHAREPAVTVKLGAGGYGTSTFVVFLQDETLYKISGPRATVAKYVVLGQEVLRQVLGLPAPPRQIARPECERGTAVAEQVIGGPATVRRDSETVAGDPVCSWITATSALSSSVRREPDAKALMAPIRTAPTSHSIPFGDEAYVDTATGRTTIRVGDDKIIDLVPLPARPVDPDLMTQFALAMSPLYTR